PPYDYFLQPGRSLHFFSRTAIFAEVGVPPVFGGNGTGLGGNVLAAVGPPDVFPTPLVSAATHSRTPRVARALLPDGHASPDRPPPVPPLSRPTRRTAASGRSPAARGSDNSRTGVPGRCSSAECRSTRSSETGRPSSSSSP